MAGWDDQRDGRQVHCIDETVIFQEPSRLLSLEDNSRGARGALCDTVGVGFFCCRGSGSILPA